MKLSQLIASYGDDKVQFQNLDQSIFHIDIERGASKITFGTEQPVNLDGPDKLGLVVWLDRERVKEIVANPGEASGGRRMTQPDLSKIVEHLDVRVKLVRQLQLETPASAVASNAALGAAAIILDAIARAIEATNPTAGAS